MKRLIILSVIFLIAGCSSSLPNKTYYQLTSDFSDSTHLQPRKVTDVIFIDNVKVANYLDKNGIVYQIDKIKYVTANNNLWLTPLSDQIKQRLLQDLSILLPNYLITAQPSLSPKASIKLYIESFHGVDTGDAVIKGYWLISNTKGVITKPFDYTLRLANDGYTALVNTLSLGWQEEEIDLVINVKF